MSASRHAFIEPLMTGEESPMKTPPPLPEPPSDRCLLVFTTLIMLGALSIPFCAISASPHFLAHYYQLFGVKTEAITLTSFWNNAAAIVSCIYFFLNVPFQWIAIKMKNTHRELQVVLSFLAIALGIAALPLVPLAASSRMGEKGALGTLVAITVWTSFAAAFAQSTTFGTSGKFPAQYAVTGPVGIGLSGFAAALIRLVEVLAVENPSKTLSLDQSYGFFIIVVLSNLTACLSVYFFRRNRFSSHYFELDESASKLASKIQLDEDGGEAAYDAATAVVGEAKASVRSMVELLYINFIIMVGSYSVYPGVAARAVDNDILWGVIVFMIFNFGSCAGRVLCLWVKFPIEKASRYCRMLTWMATLRLPIILVVSLVSLYTDAFGNNYAVSSVIQLFSGFTNGFGSAFAYFLTTKRFVAAEEKSIALRYMTVSMSCGLSCGGILGLCFTVFV